MTPRAATWLCLCIATLGSPAIAAEPEPAPAKAPPEDPRDEGDREPAEVLVEAPESVSVETLSGRRLDLPRSPIGSVGREEGATVKNGGVWFSDPNRTRYFHAPSAMTLRAGEGYLSQKELLATVLAYGLTDNITVQAGLSIPAWFWPSGINFGGGVKVGFQVHPYVHLAAEAQALIVPAAPGGVVALGTATVGSRDLHASLSVGKPFIISGSSSTPGEVLIAAAGSARLIPNLAVVTEHWLFPSTSSGLLLLNSAGLRFIGDRLAVDIAVIRNPGSLFTIWGISLPAYPWIDLTYNFTL